MAPIKDGETRALASKNGQILVKAMTGMPMFFSCLVFIYACSERLVLYFSSSLNRLSFLFYAIIFK